MRLIVNQNTKIPETEIVINCADVDGRIRSFVDYIRQYSGSLEGMIGKRSYYVPLSSILYIDTVDRKTFFYDSRHVFFSRCTLVELERKLHNTLFVRISKSCLVNLAFVISTTPQENHRLELEMVNGERLIAARHYKEGLKARLWQYHGYPSLPGAAAESRGASHTRSVLSGGKTCGPTHTPRRVATVSYGLAELLCALGLEEQIIAIVPVEENTAHILPAYRPFLTGLPAIVAEGQSLATCNQLQALEVDWVYGTWYIRKTLGENQMRCWEESGFSLFISEATIPEYASLHGLYHDILNLGRLFGVEDRAVQLMQWMRSRITDLTRRLFHVEPTRVFVYSGRINKPFTSFGGTLENDLISCAGGENIFHGHSGGYGAVTWEEVARLSPEAILLHDYADVMTVEEKQEFLCSLPILADVPAIRNRNFVVVSLLEVFPSAQNVYTVEKLIRAFHPGLL